jgi:hypothetical protein
MPGGTRAIDNDFNVTSSGQQGGQLDTDASVPLPTNEREGTKENNVAKIKVVVCYYVGCVGSKVLCFYLSVCIYYVLSIDLSVKFPN